MEYYFSAAKQTSPEGENVDATVEKLANVTINGNDQPKPGKQSKEKSRAGNQKAEKEKANLGKENSNAAKDTPQAGTEQPKDAGKYYCS